MLSLLVLWTFDHRLYKSVLLQNLLLLFKGTVKAFLQVRK